MRNRITVLNVMIDVVTMKEAVEAVKQFILQKKSRLVVTPNPEIIMMANKDEQLARIINNADLVVPDGAGVVWAARYQGDVMPERVAGYDLVQNLLIEAMSEKYKIYLFGGAPGIAEKAKKMAEERYPGVQIVGTRNGFFTKQDESEIVNDIKACQPDILLVALGVPRQEKWLEEYKEELKVPVSIGVGGTFDVMAGVVKRAPLWMQRSNLEWLFRLLSEPKRAIRMLALPHFVIKIMTTKK
ncbi:MULTISPECIES: WecB/TagA/CpsF family glycosyltransferase [Pelosinus]|uniref:N-acetylglucosaminyldiphosphoundecaprenol N-acetyl-beta-D-mannosaminyltransferase n=1 Tax=Pelosinus fermentans B4 TaxID=1149862 RepID=I9LCU9_9FIRM|nr:MULTISPECIES: WecB/TagA/CpsF family glycosyltransferase [Pelosinus]EIW18264.1 glycosyl transferase, WecB/TagA/CpsF family [Pelosinus fermentans B4]EIW24250.1 glycosyl transferase, WecB/TagA/CpsF family [Pelosinus fermentans A11]OAM94306.1 glycosyl transferase, WecB/TagA/CpsF family [Pelosinus fermentans DSM 17108]SDR05680.1 N-acetylglucosaminyldiphosphoundecaprenol N-acetyl-beta-D-mannosaminyltransferase [Pelosinus fermentans]